MTGRNIAKCLTNFTLASGEHMAFPQRGSNEQLSVLRRINGHLAFGLIGMGVVFASLGLGEAVYRVAFLDFDGATDRLPIEMLFGLAFASLTVKLLRRIYQNRRANSARIALIRHRNYKIRHAVEAMTRAIANKPAGDPCDSRRSG